MSALAPLRAWVKRRETPLARVIWTVAMARRHFSMPPVPVVHKAMYHLHVGAVSALADMMRVFYYTPLLRSRIKGGKNLNLFGGMPMILGNLDIAMGRDCRLSGATTFTGRGGPVAARLMIGDRVGIGWQTSINAGSRISIGNDVRIAGRSVLSGYPGHPEDPWRRAAGQPDDPAQCGAITLEDHVWLGAGVMVLAGVTIGKGTIVGAGSVVTSDLPPMVLAAGNPARVIRPVKKDDRLEAIS